MRLGFLSEIAALAEALDVAEKAGFVREQIADLILAGAAASPIVKMKLPRMIARDFEATDFALYLILIFNSWSMRAWRKMLI